MKDELNRSYNGGGVVYVLKVSYRDQQDSTVLLISIARFSVHLLLLHHDKSDLAHISDRYSLVIGMYLSEIRAKNI